MLRYPFYKAGGCKFWTILLWTTSLACKFWIWAMVLCLVPVLTSRDTYFLYNKFFKLCCSQSLFDATTGMSFWWCDICNLAYSSKFSQYFHHLFQKFWIPKYFSWGGWRYGIFMMRVTLYMLVKVATPSASWQPGIRIDNLACSSD